MPSKNRIVAAELATFAGSSLTTAFQVINSAGFPAPCFRLRIVNNSSLDITISYDGSTSNEFIKAATSFDLPAPSNSLPYMSMALFPLGMKVYVKSTASGTGIIYVSAYHQAI